MLLRRTRVISRLAQNTQRRFLAAGRNRHLENEQLQMAQEAGTEYQPGLSGDSAFLGWLGFGSAAVALVAIVAGYFAANPIEASYHFNQPGYEEGKENHH